MSRFPVMVLGLSLIIFLILAACASPPDLQLHPVENSPLVVSDTDDMLGTAPDTTIEVPATATIEVQTVLTLYRFDSIDTAGRWAIVNDGVMGGVSDSDLVLSEEGTLIFGGTVSLENNGGFASVRSASESYGIKNEGGIRLSVRGDGKLYRFRLYSADSPGIAYEAPFETVVDEWITVELPFSEFEPTVRGRVLTDYGSIDAGSIESVGIMVKDYQEGDFALEIASIEAYR